MDYNLQMDYINIKSSTVVRLSEHFTLMTSTGTQDLKVDIIADFEGIPEEYHEVFVNMLTSKYLNKVSFGDNPFSKCEKMPKAKFYEFWKWKFNLFK